MNNSKTTFCDKLKSLRINEGMKQKEFADIFKISQANLSRYELGIRQPDFRFISELSNHFHIPADYFINDNYKPLNEYEQRLIKYFRSLPIEKQKISVIISNSDEQELLNIFRNLPPDEQNKLTEIARTLLNLSENK